MNKPAWMRSQGALVVGVCALALLVFLGLVLNAIAFRADWARSTLDSIEPRYARLAGLQQRSTDLDEAAAASTSRLQELAYPADMPADAVGVELQKKVRAAATAAGFSVAGSNILSGQEHDVFEGVQVAVQLEGSLEHLADFFERIAETRPQIRLAELSIAPAGGRNINADRNIRVAVTLAVARVLP